MGYSFCYCVHKIEILLMRLFATSQKWHKARTSVHNTHAIINGSFWDIVPRHFFSTDWYSISNSICHQSLAMVHHSMTMTTTKWGEKVALATRINVSSLLHFCWLAVLDGIFHALEISTTAARGNLAKTVVDESTVVYIVQTLNTAQQKKVHYYNNLERMTTLQIFTVFYCVHFPL